MRTTSIACFITLLVCSALPAGAGDPEGLVRLHGPVLAAHYSPGALDRASRLQGRLDPLLRELARHARRDPRLTLYVLDREAWEAQGLGVPYGLASARNIGTVAYPASADERSIELWRRLLGGALPLAPQAATHTDPQQAAALDVADLLVETDLMRNLLTGLGLLPGEPWLDVVLAQAAARSMMLRVDPVRNARLSELYRTLAPQLASVSIPPTALASGNFSPEQRTRLEAALAPAADSVLDADGNDVVKALTKLRKKGDGRISVEAVLERWPSLDGLGPRLRTALE
jgi:hypothetical protein